MATKKKKAAPRRKTLSTPGWTPEERAIALTKTNAPETSALKRVLSFMLAGGLLAIVVMTVVQLKHKQASNAQAQTIPAAAAPSPAAQAVKAPALSVKAMAVTQPKLYAARASHFSFNALRGEGETAELRIFTRNNKLLRLIKSEAGKRGQVTLVWDGLDKQGKKVPAGTYFASVSREGGDSIQKFEIY